LKPLQGYTAPEIFGFLQGATGTQARYEATLLDDHASLADGQMAV